MAVLGLLAGFSVVFFIEVPDNGFWSFYYWSSSTFGFWMFSASLIVLFSENRKCAAINVGIYIFLMFLITTVHQSFRLYRSGAMQQESLSQLLPKHIGGWLLYSVPPAFVCAVLGIILWSGRKNTICGKLLRAMPPFFSFELIIETYSFTRQRTICPPKSRLRQVFCRIVRRTHFLLHPVRTESTGIGLVFGTFITKYRRMSMWAAIQVHVYIPC